MAAPTSYSKPGQVLIRLNAALIANAHSFFAFAAFIGALVVGMALHYTKIVQNEHFGFPDEWFPSVSATIGDRYPERSVFQLFIAVTSGPRFLLVGLLYLLMARPDSRQPKILLVSGILRTFTCGGWTYVTSTDDHDWHDIFMISYLVLTIPWTVCGINLSRPNSPALKYRKIFASVFFASLVPLIYFFIQHKVHHIPGAYTIYAFFEWALVLFDVAYDAATVYDFAALEIRIVDTQGVTSAAQYKTEATLTSNSKHKGFGYFSFIVAIFNSFIFWSVLTSLPLLIWYFPLWYMGISGFEAMLFAVVAPLVLFIPFLRKFYAYVPQFTQILTTIGVASFFFEKPHHRLALVGVGAAFGTISLANQFWGISARPLAGVHRSTAFSLGLVLSSIAKYAFYTNNPIWPIMHEENGGWNRTGIAIGLIAGLLTSRAQYTPAQPTSIAGPKESGLAAGFGVAGLIFALHTLLSDSSTIITWVWEGYPVRGPQPVPHGAVTIAAMTLGIYLGVTKRQITGSWSAFYISNVGAAVMYACDGWVGYIGGLVLTVYLLAVTPVILESAGRHNPGLSFGVGFLTLVFIYLAHVWIVAYAFVPGGPLLRERTDIVLAAQQILIGFGIYSNFRIKTTGSTSLGSGSGLMLLKKITKQTTTIITILLVLTSGITFFRFNHPPPKPYHPEDKVMTAGIWTVHFGLDNDMWASEDRMRNVINELEIDVIGFLESDTQRAIMGHRDLTQKIAEDIGYYADFGPGPNKHTWGCCLLSKFPILNSSHHLLPSPVGELAPAILATLDVYGEEVDVVVFHSGQEEDPEDRRLQSLYLEELMGNSTRPMVLLSYLVTRPLEGNYHTYVSEKSGMKDIDPTDWDRWCEYILYKNIKRSSYARVSRSTITDTEIQVGKFVIGDKSPSTNTRKDESQVPEGLRFPALFRGEGVRGHRYHVFDEPRYFE